MNTNEPSKIIETVLEGFSKREEKKMKQAISIMEKNSNPNEKQSKRNGHHLKKIHQSLPRKILKTDAPSSQERSEDASQSHSNQPPSKIQNPINTTLKLPKNTFNPNYQLPDGKKLLIVGEDGIFVYMMEYNYREKQKMINLEDQNWEFLQKLGKLEVKQEKIDATKNATKKTMEKFNQERDKVQQPLSKQYRDFTKKYINRSFLFF